MNTQELDDIRAHVERVETQFAATGQYPTVADRVDVGTLRALLDAHDAAHAEIAEARRVMTQMSENHEDKTLAEAIQWIYWQMSFKDDGIAKDQARIEALLDGSQTSGRYEGELEARVKALESALRFVLDDAEGLRDSEGYNYLSEYEEYHRLLDATKGIADE